MPYAMHRPYYTAPDLKQRANGGNMQSIEIRPERPEDYREVEELTREAFWGLNHPDCDEHLLAHKLRQSPGFVPELDLVALDNGKIIGNVMFSLGKVVDDDGKETTVLNFGPLSVLPDYQNKGVGKALLKHAITKARELGYRGILFFGHPDYYPRLGFRRAGEFGITTRGGANFDAFMAMPLYDNAFEGVTGRFHEDEAFDLEPEEVSEFDKKFPPKAKRVLTSAETLLERLAPPAQEALKSRNIKNLADLRRYSQREITAWPGISPKSVQMICTALKEDGYSWGE